MEGWHVRSICVNRIEMEERRGLVQSVLDAAVSLQPQMVRLSAVENERREAGMWGSAILAETC